MNSTPLFNRSAVKARCLLLSKTQRAGKFSRVADSFLVRLHAKLLASIEAEIHTHPSVGKTLM